MEILNHKLVDVQYDKALRINNTITPKFIVMHYTAGYTLESAVRTFNSTILAAHLTIGEDGEIIQMVPFNKGCNHAGPSVYDGVKFLNGHSIGIEHVNIGYLKLHGGNFIDAYGNKWKGDPNDLVEAAHARVGSGTYYWPKYTEEQLAVSERAVRAILKAYPSIRDIVSHEEIDTRGWKTDPGPAFPMARFKALLNETDSKGPRVTSPKVMVQVTSDTLNVRAGPSTVYPMATKWPLHKGQVVEVIGTYGKWYKVLINGFAEGWVHGAYTKSA